MSDGIDEFREGNKPLRYDFYRDGGNGEEFLIADCGLPEHRYFVNDIRVRIAPAKLVILRVPTIAQADGPFRR